MIIIYERLDRLFERFPLLRETVRTLNEADIPFAIGGSGCLFVLGNERLPDDVDIYLPDDDHDKADKLFRCGSYRYQSTQESVRNSNPNDDHTIQLTSNLVLTIKGKSYDLALTDDVLSHRLGTLYDGESIWFYPPEDVLLIKALLQRGLNVGKHDLDDIEHFLEVFSHLRKEYLQERIKKIDATERVERVFDSLK